MNKLNSGCGNSVLWWRKESKYSKKGNMLKVSSFYGKYRKPYRATTYKDLK
jgi:hypothetical protein